MRSILKGKETFRIRKGKAEVTDEVLDPDFAHHVEHHDPPSQGT